MDENKTLILLHWLTCSFTWMDMAIVYLLNFAVVFCFLILLVYRSNVFDVLEVVFWMTM